MSAACMFANIVIWSPTKYWRISLSSFTQGGTFLLIHYHRSKEGTLGHGERIAWFCKCHGTGLYWIKRTSQMWLSLHITQAIPQQLFNSSKAKAGAEVPNVLCTHTIINVWNLFHGAGLVMPAETLLYTMIALRHFWPIWNQEHVTQNFWMSLYRLHTSAHFDSGW